MCGKSTGGGETAYENQEVGPGRRWWVLEEKNQVCLVSVAWSPRGWGKGVAWLDSRWVWGDRRACPCFSEMVRISPKARQRGQNARQGRRDRDPSAVTSLDRQGKNSWFSMFLEKAVGEKGIWDMSTNWPKAWWVRPTGRSQRRPGSVELLMHQDWEGRFPTLVLNHQKELAAG